MSNYIFRVIRKRVGSETVRVLLEPYTDGQRVEVHEGDEFITGSLNRDPWLSSEQPMPKETTSGGFDDTGIIRMLRNLRRLWEKAYGNPKPVTDWYIAVGERAADQEQARISTDIGELVPSSGSKSRDDYIRGYRQGVEDAVLVAKKDRNGGNFDWIEYDWIKKP